MKNIYDVLRQKENEIQQLQKDIEALRVAARLLADDNDARRLEKALLKIEGVLEAQVNFASERARVNYVPTLVSQAEIRAAVARAGFEALETGGSGEDAEAEARLHAASWQRVSPHRSRRRWSPARTRRRFCSGRSTPDQPRR